MNEQITPVLTLTDAPARFWRMLVEKSSTKWSIEENYVASLLCHDLALIVEIAASGSGDKFLSELCRRAYKAAQLLKLDRLAFDDGHCRGERKILETIVLGG